MNIENNIEQLASVVSVILEGRTATAPEIKKLTIAVAGVMTDNLGVVFSSEDIESAVAVASNLTSAL